MKATDNLNVIEGYVARDKDDNLWLYEEYPVRMGNYWLNDNFIMSFPIPNKMFPNLKWEDEPIKVELTIKAIK